MMIQERCVKDSVCTADKEGNLTTSHTAAEGGKYFWVFGCSGAADTAEDAEQTCYALSNSGQVLLYQDKAYLRPAEVAEMVLQALPDTKEDLEQKLSVLHQELQPLEALKADVDKYAHM